MRCYSAKCLQNQYVASMAAAMSMTISGVAYIWISPILPFLQGEDALIPMDTTQISWLVATPELSILVSSLISAKISEHWGRKEGVAFGAPFLVISWIMILVTRDSFSLYIVRILQGLGMGSSLTVIPVYLGEIASVDVRGALTSVMQTMLYAGFTLQYIIGSYLSYENSALVNLVLTSAIFIFFYFTQPETPFYFILKNKEDKAKRSLMLLRGKNTPEDVTVELNEIQNNIDIDMKNKRKFSDIFNLSSVEYKILIIVELMTIHRLFSGITSISVYINNILEDANWEGLSVKLIMTLYSGVTLIMSIIGTVTIDCLGRRPLLIISCIGTAVSNLILAGFFYISEFHEDVDIESVRWLPSFSLIMFTMFFSVGLAPVPQALKSELFPTNIRVLGNVIITYISTFSLFILLRIYQILVDYFGTYSNFLLFALNSIIGIFVVYKYVPETKGKTFLEINAYFTKNTETNKVKTYDTRL